MGDYGIQHFFIIDAKTEQLYRHISNYKKSLPGAHNGAGELEKLICKIYEDHVLGKLSDARYAALDAQYAKEQNELECEIVQLEKAVSGYEQNRKSAVRFIALID